MFCHDLIVGGGLAGGLWALRLKELYPDRSILLVDAGNVDDDHHVWCCFESDVPDSLKNWFASLVSHRWPEYQIEFREKKQFASPYLAIRERELRRRVSEQINCRFRESVSMVSDRILLSGGEEIQFERLFDARGWSERPPNNCAFQKFVGIDFEFDTPIPFSCPIIMDAQVEQIDGYRFFYILPWSSKTALVEETFFSLTPQLNVEESQLRIQQYVMQKFGQRGEMTRSEQGCLPLNWSHVAPSKKAHSNEPLHEPMSDRVHPIGSRAGWVHPVTGYTLPILLQALENLEINMKVSAQTRFYFWLNRMLYFATRPEERRDVFEHFYRQPSDRIERFYSGRLSRWDQFKILQSPPPVVPLLSAIKAVFLS